MRGYVYLRAVAGLWFSVAVSHSLAVHAAEYARPGGTNEMDVICLTEQPAIVEGERVRLQAWASTGDGQPIAQPITFEWLVTEGRIQGTGTDVRWDLSAVTIEPNQPHKKVVATAKAIAPSLADTRCLLEVFIGKKEAMEPGLPSDPRDTRGGLISARRFLLPNETEEVGYGLYSYLLFSMRPQNEEQKTRYLKALESCLLRMESIDGFLKKHRRRSSLNATHLPVTKVPKFSASSAEWAQNALQVYDYTTAQDLLNKLDKAYERGPYLISVLKPLSGTDVSTSVHLSQDLAGVVPDLASDWVKNFMYFASQEQGWTEQSLRRFGFKVHNLIAVASKVAPDVASAIKPMIQIR